MTPITVTMLPTYIRGVADMEHNAIIISNRYSERTAIDTLKHELAHLLIRDSQHSAAWFQCYRALGGRGQRPDSCDRFTQYMKNIGYMPNIGNISGIQNIYY